MSKKAKALARLQSVCADFTWDEAITVMEGHGFKLIANSGSGRKFIHTATRVKVFVHKPHPGNILKPYVIRALLEGLQNSGETP